MKKTFLIMIFILLLAVSAACGQDSEKASGNSEESAVSRETAITPIAYPQFLPPELTDAPAFKQALTHNAVIRVDGKPLTTGDGARSFVESYEKGEPAELYCYSFYTPDPEDSKSSWRAYCEIFVSPGNGEKPYQRYESLPDDQVLSSLWKQDGGDFAIESLELSLYGYLVYKSESSSELCGWPVISPYEMYDNYDEMNVVKEKFISPIEYDIVSGLTFDSIDEIPNWLALFDDIGVFLDLSDSWWGQYSDGMFPFSVVMENLQKYFDVTDQMLIQAVGEAYLPQENAILYLGGRGGVPPLLRIADYQENESSAEITYILYSFVTGEPFNTYRMTVNLQDDGTFRYVSISEQGNAS